MLISPLSKVSVPLTVVILTLSKVAESDFPPHIKYVLFDAAIAANDPVAPQLKVVEFSSASTTTPNIKSKVSTAFIKNPEVDDVCAAVVETIAKPLDE